MPNLTMMNLLAFASTNVLELEGRSQHTADTLMAPQRGADTDDVDDQQLPPRKSAYRDTATPPSAAKKKTSTPAQRKTAVEAISTLSSPRNVAGASRLLPADDSPDQQPVKKRKLSTQDAQSRSAGPFGLSRTGSRVQALRDESSGSSMLSAQSGKHETAAQLLFQR